MSERNPSLRHRPLVEGDSTDLTDEQYEVVSTVILDELERVIRFRREHHRAVPFGDGASMEDSNVLDMIRALRKGHRLNDWLPRR